MLLPGTDYPIDRRSAPHPPEILASAAWRAPPDARILRWRHEQ